MSLLEHYEQQYSALIAEITACIGRLNQYNGHERREQCTKIDAQLTESHELLEQIGLEIRELNPSQRQNFTSKLNCYQVELKRLQSEYRGIKDVARKQLQTTIELGAVDDFYDDACISDDQRQRLLENSERIERTGNRLNEGYRVAIETETLGAEVLSDLHHQRETIQGTRTRLRETNAELGRASRTLNSMLLRALREKAVLYCVGVFFVLAVVISLYLTFSTSSSHEK